jgi:hypothetical protein
LCLTKGDTIAIRHADTTFLLDITDLKPAGAVFIYETDVNVRMGCGVEWSGVEWSGGMTNYVFDRSLSCSMDG